MKKKSAERENGVFEAALKEITDRIDEIAKQRPSHKEVLDFLKEVVTEQFKTKPTIKTQALNLDEDLIEKKAVEGFPVVDKGDLELDLASASALFEALCEVLRRNKNVSGDVDEIKHIMGKKSKELNLEELFKKTAAEDTEYVASLADRLKLKREILSFLAENSIKPIFEAYAGKLKGHVNQETWWRGYCPICGSKPLIAELIGTERKKFLACSSCGYEWRFKRLKCPFCENEDHKTLRYFYTKDQGGACQVEVCEKCKTYIKTVDAEALDDEVVPVVEDIGTLYLDVLAKKEGYTRGVHPLGLDLGDI